MRRRRKRRLPEPSGTEASRVCTVPVLDSTLSAKPAGAVAAPTSDQVSRSVEICGVMVMSVLAVSRG